ncbi:MAG: DnaJ family molecular chaperone [Bdellovibrionales bacterium]
MLQGNPEAIAYFESLDSISQSLLLAGVEEPIINEIFNDKSVPLHTLRRIASNWPISEKWRCIFTERLSKAANQNTKTKDAYEILGIGSDASEIEISVAYKDAIKKYHPDRVANLGQELQDLAEQKCKEINGAYDLIKNQRRSAA